VRWGCGLVLAVCTFGLIGSVAAAEFYQGKSIGLIVGNNVGGGYDQYARLLARHMGRHILGQPNFVVKHQPGAGGMVMANAMYATVPRDGLSIGLMARDSAIEQVLGNPIAKFKAENFTWLGTSSRYQSDAFCLIIRSDSGISSIADLQKSARPIIVGGSVEGGSETDVVLVGRELLKLNMQIVRGYRSSPDLLLAMQRGEIEGRAMTYTSVEKAMGDWLKQGKLRILLQFGHAERLAALPDVPTAQELVRNPVDNQLLELVEAPFEMARPFIAPPNIPPERAEILRQAFMATQQDPDYLRDAKDMQLDISPLDSEDIQKIIGRVARTPSAVIARYNAVLRSK
jgi:tripartite-type tricarboxylate transporter receptor subunit TctC